VVTYTPTLVEGRALVDKFVNYKLGKNHYTIETAKLYRYALTKFVADTGINIESVTPDILERYERQWKVSPATKNTLTKAIRALQVWAGQRGTHIHGVFEKHRHEIIKQPIPPLPKIRRFLDAIQEQRTPKATRDAAMISFMLDTGCRRGEVVRLKITDLELSENAAHIQGKGLRQREAYFTDSTAEIITEYLDTRTDLHPWAFVGIDGFKQTADARLRPDTISRLFENISQRIGEIVKPHDLRRYRITQNLSNGMDIHKAAAVFGASVHTIMMHYYDEIRDGKREAYLLTV